MRVGFRTDPDQIILLFLLFQREFVAGRSAFSIGNLEPAANRRKDASRPLAQKRWRFAGEQRYREEPLESHIVSADLNRAPVRKIQLFGPESNT